VSRESEIRQVLDANFQVVHLDLTNESHMHSVPPNSETHFKLVLVSKDFEGKRKVARHQKVYALMNSFMDQGLHALALHLYTPEEWQELESHELASPNCLGGSKS
jgi:BolA family transcriptional regulator, general stress-responsive regulator